MQKLIRFWQNLRLRAKFLLILLVGIVPVGIVAIVTLYIPLRAYDRQLYKSSAQMISLFAEQIQDELMNFEDISYRILTDTALQENLSIMKEAAPVDQRSDKGRKPGSLLQPVVFERRQLSAKNQQGQFLQSLF